MANRSSNRFSPANADYEGRAREIGRRRRETHDRADDLAVARAEAEQRRITLCRQRWPGILAAIKALLAAYNEGAGTELLTAIEQPNGTDSAVTIAARDSPCGTITITVDGDAFLVHQNAGSDSAAALHGIARRIDCSRSDSGTAAYLLQGWMDQL